MKVLKFGGSSLATPQAIENVCQIVGSDSPERLIVVVSALGGVTDSLLEIAEKASKSDESYHDEFNALRYRHQSVASAVVKYNRNIIEELINRELDKLENTLKGVFLIHELSPNSRNIIVSYGERLSSLIVSGAIKGAEHFDALSIIKTTAHHNKHTVDFAATDRLIRDNFKDLNSIAVLGGFISTDATTAGITNLGRGGSDYTASVIAAALDASVLEIWTDVDGFMTADPRIVTNAYTIPQLSFTEAMELSNFGAKVVYPPTIYPVYNKQIPIRIKNTFNSEAEGTTISSELVESSDSLIRGISSIKDTALITVSGLGMVGIIGVNNRIFRSLSDNGVSVFFVSQAASENNTSIGVNGCDASIAVDVLSREFDVEISRGEMNPIIAEADLATVAIVGENMKGHPGINGKLFDTLGRNGINVIACAQGARETNVSFIVKVKSLTKTLNVIHDSLFLSEYQVLNVFISGVGLVGGNLLEQILKQQPKLKKENLLDIRVVGISNSKRYIYNEDGLDLNLYKNLLAESENVSTPSLYAEKIKELNLINSIFVDCTANASVAECYDEFLNFNISVVAANKVAASSSYKKYAKLKKIARTKGVKYLFETNVGAGLPIINTISNLIKSGDKILKIQAVVSGTLNYLFNEMNENIPLSRAVKMAQDAGYAEPDPRLDLSGVDVMRKLVILSRESGYKVELEDVKPELFLTADFFEGSVDDFWNKLPEVDAEFEERRKVLEAQDKKWRFIATMDRGELTVGLKEVDSSTPFYDLEGSNNVILLTTERYNEYPLQIKGYGAGASVTAAGVFADIIGIANIR